MGSLTVRQTLRFVGCPQGQEEKEVNEFLNSVLLTDSNGNLYDKDSAVIYNVVNSIRDREDYDALSTEIINFFEEDLRNNTDLFKCNLSNVIEYLISFGEHNVQKVTSSMAAMFEDVSLHFNMLAGGYLVSHSFYDTNGSSADIYELDTEDDETLVIIELNYLEETEGQLA